MAQQTALETFWEQIAEILPFSLDSETAIKLYEKYQEAKEMFEEQINSAFTEGKFNGINMTMYESQEYYTQTYTTRLQNETN